MRPSSKKLGDAVLWSRARVNIDYHIASDTSSYSVPYNLVHDLVEVRSTPTIIEIAGSPMHSPTVYQSASKLTSSDCELHVRRSERSRCRVFSRVPDGRRPQ
jgi:hypothetical protein